MTERPILFSGPLVRAILDGRKTQTRRLVKPHPHDGAFYLLDGWPHRSLDGESDRIHGHEEPYASPFGKPGDRLYVRENWRPKRVSAERDGNARTVTVEYAADGELRTHVVGVDIGWREVGRMLDHPGHWIPSMNMPRWAARIFLDVESVRVERLDDITEADAIAEGAMSFQTDHGTRWTMFPEHVGKFEHGLTSARFAFGNAWNRIYGGENWNCNGKPEPWSLNPWVWVVTFKRVEAK